MATRIEPLNGNFVLISTGTDTCGLWWGKGGFLNAGKNAFMSPEFPNVLVFYSQPLRSEL